MVERQVESVQMYHYHSNEFEASHITVSLCFGLIIFLFGFGGLGGHFSHHLILIIAKQLGIQAKDKCILLLDAVVGGIIF
jgi:hypothetical protein